MVIRSELRTNDQGEPEIWTNLGDVLDWLETLPGNTPSPVAGSVALEIKRMLLEQIPNAKVVPKDTEDPE